MLEPLPNSLEHLWWLHSVSKGVEGFGSIAYSKFTIKSDNIFYFKLCYRFLFVSLFAVFMCFYQFVYPFPFE